MAISLYALAVVLWLFGGMQFITSDTVMQQQVAALIGISGSVLFGAGAVVSAIHDAQITMETRILVAVKELRGEAPSPPTSE